MTDKLTRTDAQWRSELSQEEYRITRKKGTERAFTGSYWRMDGKTGTYCCRCCDLPLFTSDDKFDSGTGWPSFHSPASEKAVAEVSDNTLFMRRTEVVCARCDAHLGHVFPDGPPPSGLRYCINSASLAFRDDSGATPEEPKANS